MREQARHLLEQSKLRNLGTERVANGADKLTWIKSSYSGSSGGDCVEGGGSSRYRPRT